MREFESSLDRIEWCRDRIADIEKLIDLERGGAARLITRTAVSGDIWWEVEAIRLPSKRLTSDIGVVAAELVAGLNDIVQILAARQGHNDVGGIDFPITDDEHSFGTHAKKLRVQTRSEPECDGGSEAYG